RRRRDDSCISRRLVCGCGNAGDGSAPALLQHSTRVEVSVATGIEVPRRIIALVVVALGFAVSCAQMLGEVEIAGQETRIGKALPADAGPAPLPVICELGTTRCQDRLLQLCTDGGTAWVTWQACASAALCEASDLSTVASCIPPTCSVEQM